MSLTRLLTRSNVFCIFCNSCNSSFIKYMFTKAKFKIGVTFSLIFCHDWYIKQQACVTSYNRHCGGLSLNDDKIALFATDLSFVMHQLG